jgi:hypothetical protein
LGNYGEQVQMKHHRIFSDDVIDGKLKKGKRFVYYSKYSELGSDFYTATDNWGTH